MPNQQKSSCPYGECQIKKSDTECAQGSASQDQENPQIRLCQDVENNNGAPTLKRIIQPCSECATSNQLLARFCRQCGAPLRRQAGHNKLEGVNWTANAEPPGGNPGVLKYFDTPQPILHGDLFVTYQNMKYVFTSIANGDTIFHVDSPGAPSYSCTPVSVKEKVFVCIPGAMWEFSSVTQSVSLTDLNGFHPAKGACPIHVPGIDCDYLVVPGEVRKGIGNILFFEVRRKAFQVREVLRLSSGDEIRKPVKIGRNEVLFTSLKGQVLIANNPTGSLDGWEVNEEKRIRYKCYLSAPSFAILSGTTFIEFYLYKAQSFKRGMIALKVDGNKLERNAYEFKGETFSKYNLKLLVFPPVISADYAIAWSGVANRCHFVSSSMRHTQIEVENLFMDSVAVAGEGNRIITVSGRSIQVFIANPSNQTANTIVLPSLQSNEPINRPILSDLGIALIQTDHNLIGWEVP